MRALRHEVPMRERMRPSPRKCLVMAVHVCLCALLTCDKNSATSADPFWYQVLFCGPLENMPASGEEKHATSDMRKQDNTAPQIGASNSSTPPGAPRLLPITDPCIDVPTLWLDAGGVKRKRHVMAATDR